MERYERKRSWVWYLLPVFVQIIGGLIAYYALRPDEPRMAKDCLYIGITLTALNVGVFVILLAIGFTFDQMFQSEFRNDMMWGV
jgi:uncharacterized Tic20 family protein